MTTLIIAEKPSVAKDIAFALGGCAQKGTYWEGKDILVASARGHLVEIGIKEADDPGFNLAALPVMPEAFLLQPLPGCKDALDNLKALASRSDVHLVINACDAGREGELIFRRLYTFIRGKAPVERMWLTSMTLGGIRDAYKARRTDAEMKPLADAAKSRAEADWLIGINGTRALTKANFVSPGDLVSAGRVQTPTLALVVDRENAIRTFVPKDFWQAMVDLAVPAGEWSATWFDPAFKPGADDSTRADRVMDQAKGQAIVAACRDVAPSSVVDEAKPESSRAPRPFDLTALQREANSKLGFSAKRTLDLAQALYEKHKVLTYPRTDSSHLPEDYPETVKATLAKLPQEYQRSAQAILEAGWVTPKHPVFDNAKISDHFAIIPTGKDPVGLSSDEESLFDLVTKRFLAAFHPAAEFLKTTRIAVIAGHHFKAVGKVLVKPGWLAVYGTTTLKSTDEDAAVLPVMSPGEPVRNMGVKLRAGKTQPPPRYTESTLLGAMETAGKALDNEDYAAAMKESGLGTPATRANIIEELLSEKKAYMARQGKALVPTDKAMRLIAALRTHGLDQLASAELTGKWESRLAGIERKQETREAFMAEIRSTTAALVEKIRAHAVAAPEGSRGGPSGPGTPLTYRDQPVSCNCGKGQMHTHAKNWKCNTCGLTIWKVICSRTTKVSDVIALLTRAQTEELEGFVSTKTGRPFKAPLRMDGDKVVFVFDRVLPR